MPVFLFTDIEGSTHLWERFSDKMPKILSRHDEIIKSEIEKYGGKIIKHTGDGVFAVFEGGAPLRCALETQKQFEKEKWEDIGELRIRVALHSGFAEKRGEDYFGPVINRTARILSTGWGGQILITPDVKSLCPLPDGAYLKDIGIHLLVIMKQQKNIMRNLLQSVER